MNGDVDDFDGEDLLTRSQAWIQAHSLSSISAAQASEYINSAAAAPGDDLAKPQQDADHRRRV